MKEHDIRPAKLLDEYIRLSALDAEVFFRDSQRTNIPCPACEEINTRFAFKKCGFDFAECPACFSLFQSPRPPKEDFERFYADSPSALYWAETFFPAVVEARRKLIFADRVEQIRALCRQHQFQPGVVMDVGAGYGLFLEEWQKVAPQTRLMALEPGQALAQVCRTKGFEVLQKPAESSADWKNRADLVTCFEVIEHVPNPLEFVRSLHGLCAKKGHVIVSGLGVEGFDIQTLWAESKSVFPPHHINFFSIEGFKKLFNRAGFANVEISTPGKLDVDIVKNAMEANPNLLAHSRFLQVLLRRGEATLSALQAFLTEHALSSHSWILAEKI